MDEKSLCLHFERSHVERPSWARSEYEGRKRNGGKKDHYGSGDCSRDIVNSTVYVVHRGDSLVVFKFKDTSSAACRASASAVPSPECPGPVACPKKGNYLLRPIPKRPVDPCFVDVLAGPPVTYLRATSTSRGRLSHSWIPTTSYTGSSCASHHGQFTHSSLRYASLGGRMFHQMGPSSCTFPYHQCGVAYNDVVVLGVSC
jgi:hypothetical protein